MTRRHTYDHVLSLLLCAGIEYQESHEIASLYNREKPYKHYVFGLYRTKESAKIIDLKPRREP